MNMYSWKLKDIIMVGIMSVLFGLFYLGMLYFGTFLTTALTPFGLGPLGYECVYGVWFMAATFAAYIIRKPGVALATETIAAFIEMLLGNFFGPIVLLSGVVQGLGAETGFLALRYKKFNWLTMMLASAGAAIFSFTLGVFFLGLSKGIAPGFLAVMFATRLVSALIFSAVVSKVLADNLAKTGVLKSYPIGEKFAVNVDENADG